LPSQVLTEILGDLDLGEFTVKLNHRRLLDAMLAIAGVPPQKYRWAGGQARGFWPPAAGCRLRPARAAAGYKHC
jgi:hypothetical protein